jgi:hypothetical protein
MKKILFLLLLLPTMSFAQSCIKIDSVWCNKKVKQISTRNVLFGIKQVAEEILSEKYNLCDSNATSVKIEVTRIGMPSSTFKIGGVGEATQITQVYIKFYFGDKIIDGLGESETRAGFVLIELTDGKVPFNNTTIGTAIKKAILNASEKL